MSNVFASLPVDLQSEVIEDLVNHEGVRIERIISKGHTSPENGWYDQDENERVMVLQGSGTLTFQDGNEVRLFPGDYINIPAHAKHKVSGTDPMATTIWLAVFY